MRTAIGGLLLSTSVLMLGCMIDLTHGAGAWGGGITGSSGTRGEGRVDYQITYETGAGGVYLVLVADGVSGGSARSGDHAQGSFAATDGRVIAWACETGDGRTGTVTIAGTEHALAAGGLFLITTRHNRTHIRQVRADLSRLKKGGAIDLDTLRATFPDDPATAAFLDAVATPKPVPRDPSALPPPPTPLRGPAPLSATTGG